MAASQFFISEKEGVSLFSLGPPFSCIFKSPGTLNCWHKSTMAIFNTKLSVFDLSGEPRCLIREMPFLLTPRRIEWSPDGTLLVVLLPNEGRNNLILLRISKNGGEIIWSAKHQHTKTGSVLIFLPPIATKTLTFILPKRNRMHIFAANATVVKNAPDDNNKYFREIGTINLPRFTSEKLYTSNSPKNASKIAFFASSTEQVQSCIKIYLVHQLGSIGNESKNNQLTPLVNFNVGFTDSAEMEWNILGNRLLVIAVCTVDSAGKNYGSVANCFLIKTDEEDLDVFGGKEGYKLNDKPVHDAKWCPTANIFALIQGNSPSEITLHDHNGIQLYSFPSGYRNMIRWNPTGNYIIFAGFGNLAGQITLYKLDSKAQSNSISQSIQVINDWRDPCTVICEWSKDARFLLMASTFPRMKVDNGVKILTYDGDIVLNLPLSQLYEACWINDGSGPVELPPAKPKPQTRPKLLYRPKKDSNPIEALFEKLSLQKRALTYKMTPKDQVYMQSFRKYVSTVKPLSFSDWYSQYVSNDKNNVVKH